MSEDAEMVDIELALDAVYQALKADQDLGENVPMDGPAVWSLDVRRTVIYLAIESMLKEGLA